MHVDKQTNSPILCIHYIYMYIKNHSTAGMCCIFLAWLKCSHHYWVEGGGPLANHCAGNNNFSQMHQANSCSFVKPNAILNMQVVRRQMVG